MKFCNANIGSNNGSATFTVTGFSSSLNYDILVSPWLPKQMLMT
jgi:hypothetical protein